MYASSFQAQIDVLKVVQASEDHCTPVIFHTNISEHNILSSGDKVHPIEIGTNGEFVDIRQVIEALRTVPSNIAPGSTHFYEGMTIVKTVVERERIQSRFSGKVVIAYVSWGS